MTAHPIPDAALASHIAILGKTGSGKTYAAKGVVESILTEGGRVCVIDPTGAWHGLRSSASGKRAGFPVVIFGGGAAVDGGNMSEIAYGKTPLGQLIYDLGFTKLSDRYLARKHRLPITDIRRYRAATLKGLKRPRKRRSRRAR
jgi:DNA helicase HerA-like ATPase